VSGGPELAPPGFTTRGVSSRWMPEATGIPAGTSAVSSPEETKVVGRLSISALVDGSRSSSCAPGRKFVPNACTPKLVALLSTLGPTARSTGAPPPPHWHDGRQAPGHVVSTGGSHSSGGWRTPSPQTGAEGETRLTLAPFCTVTRAPTSWPTKVEGSFAPDLSVTLASGAFTVAAT